MYTYHLAIYIYLKSYALEFPVNIMKIKFKRKKIINQKKNSQIEYNSKKCKHFIFQSMKLIILNK